MYQDFNNLNPNVASGRKFLLPATFQEEETQHQHNKF